MSEQEAQRFTRTINHKMSLDTLQAIRRNAVQRSNPTDDEYQNDDYRDPKKINDDKRMLETLNGVQRAKNERRRRK